MLFFFFKLVVCNFHTSWSSESFLGKLNYNIPSTSHRYINYQCIALLFPNLADTLLSR